MQIQDMVVFVTGANRGLGRAFACAALALGAKKVYAAARDPARILLSGVQTVRLDVTRADDADAAAETCRDVNVLINNAASRAARRCSRPAAWMLRAPSSRPLLRPWAPEPGLRTRACSARRRRHRQHASHGGRERTQGQPRRRGAADPARAGGRRRGSVGRAISRDAKRGLSADPGFYLQPAA